jgi:hypothetical protein
MTSETFDTQFWRDVATGYEQVARDASLQVTIERENKQALIKDNQGIVVIMIGNARNEKPPALVVPPGQGKGDQ